MSKIGGLFWTNVKAELEDQDKTINDLEMELANVGRPVTYLKFALQDDALPSNWIVFETIEKFLNCDLWVFFVEEEKK